MSITIIDRFQKFKPTDIPDCYMWHDASDSDTITLTSGRVSQWDDKSGNGYDATQTNNDYRPLVSTSPDSGQPSIDFTSTRSCHLKTSATHLDELTEFGAIHKIANTYPGQCPLGANMTVGKLAAGIGLLIPQESYADPNGILMLLGTEVGETSKISSGMNGALDHIIYGSASATDQQVLAYLNDGSVGTDPGTDTSHPDITGDYWIGVGTNYTSQTNGSDTYFKGHLMEVIRYDRVLTDKERNQVRYYLNERWRCY